MRSWNHFLKTLYRFLTAKMNSQIRETRRRKIQIRMQIDREVLVLVRAQVTTFTMLTSCRVREKSEESGSNWDRDTWLRMIWSGLINMWMKFLMLFSSSKLTSHLKRWKLLWKQIRMPIIMVQTITTSSSSSSSHSPSRSLQLAFCRICRLQRLGRTGISRRRKICKSTP